MWKPTMESIHSEGTQDPRPYCHSQQWVAADTLQLLIPAESCCTAHTGGSYPVNEEVWKPLACYLKTGFFSWQASGPEDKTQHRTHTQNSKHSWKWERICEIKYMSFYKLGFTSFRLIGRRRDSFLHAASKDTRDLSQSSVSLKQTGRS